MNKTESFLKNQAQLLKQLVFAFSICSLCFNTLHSQSLIGKWLVKDVSVSAIRKLSEIEKQQIQVLEQNYLLNHKDKTIVEYKTGGILINTVVTEEGKPESTSYKWWLNKNKLLTNNPNEAKGFVTTYTVKDSLLYLISFEKAHGVTIKTTYLRQ